MRAGLQGGVDRRHVDDAGVVSRLEKDLGAYLRDIGRLAIAFSGGTDSSYLASVALDADIDFRLYHVRSVFEKKDVTSDALRMCSDLGIEVSIIDADILSDPDIRGNDGLRCYHCKKAVFGRIIEAAEADGYTMVADGTNASDDESERPGMRALREMGVISPLRDCDLTKDMIRELSRIRGLPTWNVPSDSCLATRVVTGTELTRDLLSKTEEAERRLHDEYGLIGHRARTDGHGCIIEVRAQDWDRMSASMDGVSSLLSDLYDGIVLSDRKR